MQKGQGLILVIIGILVIAVVAGRAFYLGRQTTPKPSSTPVVPSQQTTQPPLIPTPSPASDETANWKTYTNNEYGFSFRYPNDWDTVNLGISLIIAPQSIVTEIRKIKGGFGGGSGLISTLYINKEKIPTKSDEFQQVSSTQMTIDGKDATFHTITVTQENPLGEPGDKLFQVEIPFNKGFVEYELVNSKYRSIYDQILSTFKFTQ